MPCVCVAFATPPTECRARNRVARQECPAAGARGTVAPVSRAASTARGRRVRRSYSPKRHVFAPRRHTSRREASQAARQRAEPVGLRFGLQVPTFDWPGGAGETRSDVGRNRSRGGGRRLRERVGHGPLPADPDVRARVARHARELHDARVPRGAHRAGATRHPCDRHHAASRRAARQDDRDARRRLGRPRQLRARRRMVRGRERSTRHPVPSARASGTRCSRTRSSSCRCSGARARRPSKVASCACPKAMCYPRPLQEHVPILVGGNGERRTLAPGGPVRGRVQHHRRGRRRRPQGRRVAVAL